MRIWEGGREVEKKEKKRKGGEEVKSKGGEEGRKRR